MSRISPFYFNINEYNDEEIANICPRYLKWMNKVKAFDFSKRKKGKIERSVPAFELKYKRSENLRTPKRSKSFLSKIRKGGQNLRVRVRTSADLWRRWIRGGIMYNTELNENDELEQNEQEITTQVMPVQPPTVIIQVEPQPSKEATPPPKREESKQTENTEEVNKNNENVKQKELENEIPQQSDAPKQNENTEQNENKEQNENTEQNEIPEQNEKSEENLKLKENLNLEENEKSKTDENQLESIETNINLNENSGENQKQNNEIEAEKSETKDTQSIGKSEISSEENTEPKTKEIVIQSTDHTNSNISIGNSSTGMPEVVANND